MTSTFYYRASDSAGRIVEGEMRSASQRQAIEDLRQKLLFPLDVTEKSMDGGRSARAHRMSQDEALAVWTRTTATMLGAGVNLERALAFMPGDGGSTALDIVIAQVRREVSEGSSLSLALRRHPRVFSPLYVAMVAAGEETGALSKVMDRVADNLDEGSELRSKVRSALLYPALMAFVATLGVTIILLFVVPRFVDMLAEVGGSLPLSTRLLVGASHVVTGWWWMIVVLAALSVWLVRRLFADGENLLRWHEWRLGLPLVGAFERDQMTARYARTLGLLEQGGVGLLPALRIASSAVTNRYMAARLRGVEQSVSEGKRLGAGLHGILPPLAVQLISLGEETGRVGEMAMRAAESYEVSLSRRLRSMIALIEPILIVVFGALVGFVALAMLQAIYSVNTNIL